MIYELNILQPNDGITCIAKIGTQVSKQDFLKNPNKLYFIEGIGTIVGHVSHEIKRITLFKDDQSFQYPMGEYEVQPNTSVWTTK